MRVSLAHDAPSAENGRLADTPDLKAFFEALPDILEAGHGIFSFWNGLGATSECSTRYKQI
jgi:protein arginine N-methyltransferase 2